MALLLEVKGVVHCGKKYAAHDATILLGVMVTKLVVIALKKNVCKSNHVAFGGVCAFVYANGIDDSIKNCESRCGNVFTGCCRCFGNEEWPYQR